MRALFPRFPCVRSASALCVLAAVSAATGAGCKSTSRDDMIDSASRSMAVEDRPSLAVPASSGETPEASESRGGGPLTVPGALNVLANARCQREEVCGRVGEGKAYVDRETCVRVTLQSHASDVTMLECAKGIDHPALSSCASKLRAVACEHDAPPASTACAKKLCL